MSGMNNIVMVATFSVILRWSTSSFDYSGKGKPPMFGDYEAQRHWMEITFNLPVSEWYFNTENNDLLYWGLDYPPLTGYHSLLMGSVANKLDPKYVALNESRGFESPKHKLFMRYTVLISDLLSYIPAVILYSFVNTVFNKSRFSVMPDAYVMLIYPALILIDHGHFQYNCVSLGLALMSIIALFGGYDVISSMLYCLSISYKQMMLYYALPFFFYHLGKCLQISKAVGTKAAVLKLIMISFSVILTFFTCWYPASQNSQQFYQIINRIFPLNRGIFEDKVSNFWCLVNVLFKFRTYVSNGTLAIVCGILTLSASLPSCLNLFLRPSKNKFILSLINSSLAFFLFSYQVHEKTILIVAIPIILYYRVESFHCFWFLLVSIFSMFPLLQKDGLILPFIGLTGIFFISVPLFYNIPNHNTKIYDRYLPYIYNMSLFVYILTMILSIFLRPPERLPDIFSLLISCFSSLHFLYFFIYFNYVQLFSKIKNSV